MIFEYDENKSNSNKLKHGINFEEAKELWTDPYSFAIQSNNNTDEERYLVLGQITSNLYTAIITYRLNNIRIISVRRSRQKEIEIYESLRIR